MTALNEIVVRSFLHCIEGYWVELFSQVSGVCLLLGVLGMGGFLRF